MNVEWTVNELASRAGISPRTLRHYHQIGLLPPDRIGANGYRYYGPVAVARLQRVLLLRTTGLGLADIAATLGDESDDGIEVEALEAHLAQLHREQDTIAQRITAVSHTLAMRREGRQPRMDLMLEGFNDRYEDEVTERWGRDAFDQSNRWWHAKSIEEQRRFQAEAEALLARWGQLQRDGIAPTGAVAQAHAAEHVAWFAQIPGTPAHAGERANTRAMLHGMAELYATNPDFHSVFGSSEATTFAALALRHYADQHYADQHCSD